ncbi:hypothetical protein GCM10010256_45990 [Streptomyces coeruleorubidus]|uniref:Uncharacterized protein n=1 Tax=Streptomyces coeruleorubidus TaxID=116188 RepID=A0A5J6HXL5_STRC4|nr:hypothetical protein CP976_02270 [Streptomyces coeruleorubidus]GGT81108.1 hypothetical protein GCM10010256_45990 [Streptomyces coeruleorubidus]
MSRPADEPLHTNWCLQPGFVVRARYARATAFPVLQPLGLAGCGGVTGGHQWSVSPWMRRVGLAVWLVAAVVVVLVAAFWGIKRL